MLPEKVVVYDKPAYDGRLVGLEYPCALEPHAFPSPRSVCRSIRRVLPLEIEGAFTSPDSHTIVVQAQGPLAVTTTIWLHIGNSYSTEGRA